MIECRDIHTLIRSDQSAAGAEVQDHLDQCAPCRLLVERGAQVGRAMALSEMTPLEAGALDDLVGRIASRCQAERGPRAWLRSRSTRLRLGVTGLSAALITGLVMLAVSRPDLVVYPTGRMSAVILVLVGLGGAVAAVTLRPLHRPGLSRHAVVGILIAALTVPIAIALLPMAHTAHPASLAGAGADFIQRAMGCFLFGIELGLPLLLLVLLFDRRPFRPVRGLLVAGLAGLLGNLVLQLHCPINDAGHLVVGHATVGVGLGLLVLAGWAALTLQRRLPR